MDQNESHLASPLVGDPDPMEPGKHPHKGNGFWMTWFTILCTMVGTGILQLPFTLKQGGWVCLAIIIIVALMTNYTGHILIKQLYYSAQGGPARLDNYPAIGEEACGKAGRALVQVFHKATLLGISTLFLILAGEFLTESLGGDGNGLLFADNDPAKWTTIWTLISGFVVLVPILTLHTMKEIAPLTAFGMIASVLCVVVVVSFSFILFPLTPNTTANVGNLTGVNCSAEFPDHCPYNIHKVIDWALFPSAFAAVTLSFGGHAVFPSIEEHMANRSDFHRTFNWAFVLLTTLYVATAVPGYLVFGNATMSPIFSNFPEDRSTLGIICTVAKLLLALHVLTAYCILNNVAVLEFEATCIDLPHRSRKMRFWLRTAMRFGIVSATVVVAIVIPYFADFMTLVGALCLTMIVFILPVIFDWILRGRRLKAMVPGENGVSIPERIWGGLVILVGATGGAIGSVQATQAIIEKLTAAGK